MKIHEKHRNAYTALMDGGVVQFKRSALDFAYDPWETVDDMTPISILCSTEFETRAIRRIKKWKWQFHVAGTSCTTDHLTLNEANDLLGHLGWKLTKLDDTELEIEV